MTTGIEWTDETWNFVRGCRRVSAGCQHCYAEQAAARVNRQLRAQGRPEPYEGLVQLVTRDRGDRKVQEARWTGIVQFVPHRLAEPLKWRAPRDVFVNSMSDLFHEDVPNEVIAAAYGVMAACPQHTFQILTKRPERRKAWHQWLDGRAKAIAVADPDSPWWGVLVCLIEASKALEYITDVEISMDGAVKTRGERDLLSGGSGATWPLPNVWEGVSVENQETADERIPVLLATPAAVRWLSCEPLLSGIDLRCIQHRREFEVDALTGEHGVYRPLAGRGPRVDWVVAGCESGLQARPCRVNDLRALRDQCADAGTKFFLKQACKRIVPAVDALQMIDGGYSPPITAGPGSKRKPGGIITIPRLDGVQHTAKPDRYSPP